MYIDELMGSLKSRPLSEFCYEVRYEAVILKVGKYTVGIADPEPRQPDVVAIISLRMRLSKGDQITIGETTYRVLGIEEKVDLNCVHVLVQELTALAS